KIYKGFDNELICPHPIPSDAAHLIIPEQYKISFRNENFLLYDGKMMEKDLFSSQLNILSRLSVVCYSWRIKQCINCMCFCVNGAKTEIMYRRVWEKVRENVEILF
ncbi:LOW QUALITY PROTEIN: hypothetical protein HZS_5686, partial [Henneguya salminicola]